MNGISFNCGSMDQFFNYGPAAGGDCEDAGMVNGDLPAFDNGLPFQDPVDSMSFSNDDNRFSPLDGGGYFNCVDSFDATPSC